MKTVSRGVLVLALACAALTPGRQLGAQQAPRAMTLLDVIDVPSVRDPQLSPDGRRVLYVRADADWKADHDVSHIWRVGADGGGTIQLTNGPGSESEPRWSPDGARIAFLAGRDSAEHTQIYLIDDAGGEARALTHHATSVHDITWSRDGAAIYFVAPDEKSAEQERREKQKDDVYAFDENYQQEHLWKVDVATGEETQLTQGDWSVVGYRLSRDGRRIVLERGPTPLLDDLRRRELWIANADGSGARQLTHNDVPESGGELSPDGSTVLFTTDANQRFESYYNSKIFLIPAAGGDARVLLPDLPYEIGDATWSADGKSIYFAANTGVREELFRADVASRKVTALTHGDHAIYGWSYVPGLDRQVFTIDDATSPGDVWALDAGAAQPTQVTHVFDDLTTRFRLPRQEAIQWKGRDGARVEGLLFYPLDYQRGRRYPLVVQAHGGPAASDKFGFPGGSTFPAVLTAMSYFVLKPNYRGSTGYGDAFLRDMVGHYYHEAHLDVLAGVDDLIRRGLVAPDSLVMMGWSAGGHMTDKIITFTDRFKAASAGAGASDWISMYAQSDVRYYRTPWFGGTPWQKNAPIAAYWDNSPLKDVWRVKTPTIFLVGAQDHRVPMPQSVEMYRGLKSNGVPTHLYVAPREPHGWGELRHQLFRDNADIAWFEKWVRGRAYEWEKPPGT
jgi:dipeptidyl aminopeptidase/acylaminoacyl peptidase